MTLPSILKKFSMSLSYLKTTALKHIYLSQKINYQIDI